MKTVFFDVDTQIDFLFPAGGLYARGAEHLAPFLARLTSHAGSRGIPILSTADAHSEDDAEFHDWPPHCIAGTLGQHKAPGTLLAKQAVVGVERGLAALGGAPQVILEKRALDCFTNPNLPALLEHLGADRYVVYGVVTEICVRFAAAGLLETGKRVELVTDAVCALRHGEADRFLRDFQSGGGLLTTTAAVCA